MQYRNSAKTGIKVSRCCLGAMIFGAAGNTGHEDSIQIILEALDVGSTS